MTPGNFSVNLTGTCSEVFIHRVGTDQRNTVHRVSTNDYGPGFMDYVNYTKMTVLILLLALRATLKSLLLSGITSSGLLSCSNSIHFSLVAQ